MPSAALIVALLRSLASFSSAINPVPQHLLHARTRPQIERLPDGRVIVFGGFAGNTVGVPETEIYDPATGQWTEADPLRDPRYCGEQVSLGKNRILELGGRPYPLGSSSASVEIFDAATGSWTEAAPMSTPRDAFGAIVLRDGRVLATGGYAAVDGHGDAISASEIYDPRTDTWSSAADRPQPAWLTFTYRLPDGRVLSAGGSANGVLSSAYIYDPLQDRWNSAPPMLYPHEGGQSADLGTNGFLVAGGYGNGPNSYQSGTERYDPALRRWIPSGALSNPRQAAALATVGRNAVLVGGTRGGGGMSDVEIYSASDNRWRAGPPLRQPRESAAAIALDETHVLVVGGSDGSRPLDSVEIVDVDGKPAEYPGAPGAAPDTLAVQNLNGGWPVPDPLPSPRWAAAAAAVDGRLYLFGGMNGRWLNDVLRLDPKTGHWTQLGFMDVPRMAAAAAVVDGRILVSGGSVYRMNGVTSNDLVVYDPRTGAWRSGPAMTAARQSHDMFSLGGKLYAFGGFGGADSFERLSHGRWSPAGATPNAFFARAAAVVDGKAYFAGGVDMTPNQNRRHAELDVYDPAADSWSSLTAMPTAREGAAAAVLNGKIYVIGGDDDTHQPLSTVEAYDPRTDSWTAEAPLPAAVRNASAAVLDGRLYVVGGAEAAAGDFGVDDVQVYDPASGRWTLSRGPSAPHDAYRPPRRLPPPQPLPPPKSPAMSFATKSPARPHDYAVIVGVGRYERLPPADFAEDDARDATAMMTALGVPEENIVTLSGPRASMTEVVKYVEEWLPDRVAPDSRVYFYYSGHGAPNVLDGVPYLMPWDADASFVKSTGLPLERVYAALGKLPAKEVIAMIDACFSGAGGRSVLAPGTRPLVTVRAPSHVPANISILTASGGNEIAGSEPRYGHGLFSYYVMRGLSGEADAAGTGHVTLRQLHAYVRKHVIIEAREENREQTPTLSTPDPGLRLY